MHDIGEASDAQLVTAIARYSEVALAEVYRRHGGAVFGLARKVLSNAAEAEDVTQEIFLRLWNQPDRFDPSAARCVPSCWPSPTPGRSTRCDPSTRDASGRTGRRAHRDGGLRPAA